MSLTFDFVEIKDYETFCWDESGKMRPVTQALVFQTMAVGMGEITADNWQEFAARLELSEDVFGESLVQDKKSVRITVEDVKAHIGLRTNVHPKESWAKFLGKLREHAEHRIKDRIRQLKAAG